MAAITGFTYETYFLSLRTMRRFWRVPSNFISIVFFPLMQLLVFSQLYKDIVQLPAFGAETSYLAYLAPGQVAFTAFMAVNWASFGFLIEYRSGYVDKLRASPIGRWSILAAEMAPLAFQAAVMAGIVLVVSVLLGASVATGIPGFVFILLLSGAFGVAFAGISFVPALLTRSEQATGSLAMLAFPLLFMSTAFVPQQLMPEWMQLVNQWNPVSYVIEAMRALMVTGYDWDAIGKAVLAMAILGVVMHSVTLWGFHRLSK